MSDTPPTPAAEPRDQLLARVAFAATWELDPNDEWVRWDGNVEAVFGYTREEVGSSRAWWRDRVHPDDAPRNERTAQEAIASGAAGWTMQYRFQRKDGSWAWVEARCAIERDETGRAHRVAGAIMDITDRHRTEEAARATQHLLTQVLDLLPVGLVVMDRGGNIMLKNPTSDAIWGRIIESGERRYAATRAFRHATGDPVHPDEWASVRAVKNGTLTRDELLDIEAFDGQRRTIENYAAPMRDAAGNITGAVVVNQDVTERVRASEALRKTERLLVEAETLGLTGSWEQDLLTGEVFNTEANRKLFFGDDLTKGKRLEDYVDVIHPDDAAWTMKRRGELLNGTGSSDIEYRVIWPDKSVHWIFGRATVIRDASGRPTRVYGTNRDITARKNTEDELGRRAGQLESLSRKLIQAQEAERRAVARELHDDFGQVLTALKLNLQRRDRDDAESIALVDGAIARMRDLAQDLRPPLLDEGGLVESLTWYVEREARRAGLTFRLALAPSTLGPPPPSRPRPSGLCRKRSPTSSATRRPERWRSSSNSTTAPWSSWCTTMVAGSTLPPRVGARPTARARG